MSGVARCLTGEAIRGQFLMYHTLLRWIPCPSVSCLWNPCKCWLQLLAIFVSLHLRDFHYGRGTGSPFRFKHSRLLARLRSTNMPGYFLHYLNYLKSRQGGPRWLMASYERLLKFRSSAVPPILSSSGTLLSRIEPRRIREIPPRAYAPV